MDSEPGHGSGYRNEARRPWQLLIWGNQGLSGSPDSWHLGNKGSSGDIKTQRRPEEGRLSSENVKCLEPGGSDSPCQMRHYKQESFPGLWIYRPQNNDGEACRENNDNTEAPFSMAKSFHSSHSLQPGGSWLLGSGRAVVWLAP